MFSEFNFVLSDSNCLVMILDWKWNRLLGSAIAKFSWGEKLDYAPNLID